MGASKGKGRGEEPNGYLLYQLSYADLAANGGDRTRDTMYSLPVTTFVRARRRNGETWIAISIRCTTQH
jgi:hypothetical protein